MKKPTRGGPSGTVIPMPPKRRDGRPSKYPGTVLIDRLYDRELGRFDDGEDGIELNDNFVLDSEEDASAPGGERPEGVTAIVGVTFEPATTADQRRRLRHGQAMCAIVHVPSPAWVVRSRSIFGPLSASLAGFQTDRVSKHCLVRL
ncbi:hypothetical protein ACKWRH_37140 [Bradyrhizobium sp. Pa8]|uniref:hypothetical protein n=1 Tax=Bradyrhizobium sp. Pa8 TaxID=3386552 RepID=UPI00403F8AFB